MAVSIAQHRQQFPYLDRYTYFNYGGQGLMAQSTLAMLQQNQDRLQESAPFSLATNAWIIQEMADLRQTMAQELGVTPESISLTESTTVGCNIALWGLDWRAGDRVLITDCEHQGVIALVQELQHRFGIEIDVCPLMATLNQGDAVAAIASQLKPQTRVVTLSHVLWNTGQVLPLGEIIHCCRSRGVLVLVDAAQSVGVLPLNLADLDPDFYAFTGHKWWCGPAGVGGFYVRPQIQDSLRPTFVGWRSIATNAQGKPKGWQADGQRYEVATSAVPLYGGLREAIALQQQAGSAQERYRRICDLSGILWQRLRQLPQVQCLRTQPPEAGLVSFQLRNGQHGALVSDLEQQRIYVRQLLDPNCVRASVHYFSTEAEIDLLVTAIAQLG
jgi:L-cysteine/cystine lyase